MEVGLKYYKYTDNKGNIKKDVGLVTARTAIKSKRKVEDDRSLTTINEEKLHIVSERKPIIQGVTLEEISKEEFDALPAEAIKDSKKFERLLKFQEFRQKREDKIAKIRERRSEVKSEIKVVDDTTYADLSAKIENGESTLPAPKKDKKDK